MIAEKGIVPGNHPLLTTLGDQGMLIARRDDTAKSRLEEHILETGTHLKRQEPVKPGLPNHLLTRPACDLTKITIAECHFAMHIQNNGNQFDVFKQLTPAALGLTQCTISLLYFGDIYAHHLVFQKITGVIQNRAGSPARPTGLAIFQDKTMFYCDWAVKGDERIGHFIDQWLVFGRDDWFKRSPNDLFAFFSKVMQGSSISKCHRAVCQKSQNHFRVVFYNRPIACFA